MDVNIRKKGAKEWIHSSAKWNKNLHIIKSRDLGAGEYEMELRCMKCKEVLYEVLSLELRNADTLKKRKIAVKIPFFLQHSVLTKCKKSAEMNTQTASKILRSTGSECQFNFVCY